MNSYCSSLLFDHGPNPFTINLRNAASNNCNSCTTLWSGSSLELKLLNILPRKTTGWKQHPETDQIIRIECGTALLILASKKCHPDSQKTLRNGDAVFVPTGTWYSLKNISKCPLKLSLVQISSNNFKN